MMTMDNRAVDLPANDNSDLDEDVQESDKYLAAQLSHASTPKEWTYSMRRSMQEISPHVFLGPYSAASRTKLEYLKEHGITHIICVRQAVEAHFIRPNFPETFQYLTLDIADTATENIIQHFPTVVRFIDQAIEAGGNVLVHGNAGISRSAALCIAYLMQKFNLTRSEAYLWIQNTRFCVNPNDGFMDQLHEYEPIYRAQKAMPPDPRPAERESIKRNIDEINMDKSESVDTMES